MISKAIGGRNNLMVLISNLYIFPSPLVLVYCSEAFEIAEEKHLSPVIVSENLPNLEQTNKTS